MSAEREAHTGPATQNARLSVLVVGDWVVDEHWVTGIERSATASRRGRAHFHALHGINTTVEALCGAGLTASILGRAQTRGVTAGVGAHLCTVHGIGMWHPDDDEVLAAMMDPHNTEGSSPFRLTRPRRSASAPDDIRIHLHNIARLIDPPSAEFATTRVIRIYERTSGDSVRLEQRIDWELPPKRDASGGRSWVHDMSQLDPLIQNSTSQLPKRPDAIVIKDLLKGVVGERMIAWLLKHFGDQGIPWLISSKAWKPSWLAKLRNEWVPLLLIPQVAAQEAIRHGQINAWRIARGIPSRTALDRIDDHDRGILKSDGQMRRPMKDSRLTVVLPGGMSVIAKSRHDDSEELLFHPQDSLHELAVGVPMASVLFASLVGLMIEEQGASHTEVLEDGLEFTDRWMQHEVGRIQNTASWTPQGEPLLRSRHEFVATRGKLVRSPWKATREIWRQARALENLGIVQHDAKPRLELWRAMTDLEGYIALEPSKRAAIKSILRSLRGFRTAGDAKHHSIMLRAKPGSGKTLLVSKLAARAGFHFLPFNITQMSAREHLFDAFDEIVSNQAVLPAEQPLLVFFDEINAPLENGPVYAAFLDPIDTGLYRRAGRAFQIRPCVWIFAGTDIDTSNPATKGSDLKSRFTEGPIAFEPQTSESDDAHLERVYVGVSMIQDVFPEVRLVSKKVLRAFAHLRGDLTLREQTRLIRSFSGIRDGEVWADNIKKALHDCSALVQSDLDVWESGSDETLIEIVRYPKTDSYGPARES